jgi:hypothetical protein
MMTGRRIQMKRGASIAALGLMMLGACGDGLSDPSESSAPIQTSARSYEFVRDTVVILGDSFPRLGAEIPYTYANPTNRPIYIVQCRVPPAFVQRLSESGAWELFWGSSLSCLSAPTVIAPNDSFSSTLQFRAVEFGVEGLSPRFSREDLNGTYRIVFLNVVHLDDPSQYPNGSLLPESERVSNPFEMVMR